MRRDDRYIMMHDGDRWNQGFRSMHVHDAGLNEETISEGAERHSRGHEFLRLVVPSSSSGTSSSGRRSSSSRRQLLPARLGKRIVHDGAQTQSNRPLQVLPSRRRRRRNLLRPSLRRRLWHAGRRRGKTIIVRRPRKVDVGWWWWR